MNDKDEQLLERFFSEARRTELPDAGFSRRVMRSLPDRVIGLSRLWTAFCAALGVVLCAAFGAWEGLGERLGGALRSMMDIELSRSGLLNLLLGFALVAVLAVAEVVDRLRYRW